MSRRYRFEPVEVSVRTGPVRTGSLRAQDAGSAGSAGRAPERFRWRGRGYVVCAVVAQWVEALPWWTGASGQRHVWRVEAASRTGTVGVYDLHCMQRGVGHVRWVMGQVFD